MNNEFPIFDISENVIRYPEPMGSKKKFWFHHDELGLCLFKYIRPNTGDDWAEKISAELADVMQLPHAQYELGIREDQLGAISPNFLHLLEKDNHLDLFHGNEILMAIDPDYPGKRYYQVSQHTLDKVFEFLKHEHIKIPLCWTPPSTIKTSEDVFVGYLILDAWIGNTDRHHQNWAIVIAWQSESHCQWHLAPTFDHASSLGCHLTDKERSERLNTRDHRYSLETYVTKARSAFFLRKEDQKPITTYKVVDWCLGNYPDCTGRWINILNSINDDDILNIVKRIPKIRISETAAEFAYRMLIINKNNLIELLRN